ncbi:MAG: alpha/beta fold hydrolase [Deltaproteobacteria bacterium]|nr:alpha/beta fold hydrolase [Deltaproteobacteria bacterium]
MRILERQGERIAYQVFGEGEAVVLGHSLLFDGRMWEEVAPALASRHRVLNVDARGHGGSTATRSFTLEDLADDWRAILDREKIDRAVLVGLSMGGMTAMRLALEAPDRVSGLALLDTSADPEPWDKRLQYLAMAEVTRRIGYVSPIIGRVSRVMFGPTTHAARPALVRESMTRILQNDRRQLYHAARAVFSRGPVRHRLSALRCPAIVVVGAEDAATPPFRARRIADAMGGAPVHVLDGSGHITALEAAPALLELLLPFIASAMQRSRTS